MQICKVIAFFVVTCIFLQVKGSPLINNSKHTGGTEHKSDKFHILQQLKSYHLFPYWVSEIGEIALLVLDYVWHNELTEQIQQVDDQVSEINSKLDALLAITSPAPPQLFFQLKKSSPVVDVSAVENANLKIADVPNGKTELKWKKITKEDGNKIHNNY